LPIRRRWVFRDLGRLLTYDVVQVPEVLDSARIYAYRHKTVLDGDEKKDESYDYRECA
jgi:hypothetical protein